MKIESSLVNRSGQRLRVMYNESDPLVDLEDKLFQAIHAFCFYGDKLVVVYADEKKYWTPIGGRIENGETYEEAVVRETLEESNMKVLHQELIGYQDIYETDRIVRQTRSMCIVEPNGAFVEDLNGEITEMRLIDPSDYKEFFDWGEVGDRIMERALSMKKKFEEGMDVYAEIGIGNSSFFSTEYEKGDIEYRVPKFEKPKKVNGYYLRLWFLKKVFILSTNDGFEISNKDRNRFKLLFGISGINPD